MALFYETNNQYINQKIIQITIGLTHELMICAKR